MAMVRWQIEKARAEALAFAGHCEILLIELDEKLDRQRYDSDKREWVKVEVKPAPGDMSWGSKASGTLRRKSMDLTRMLADLRRPHGG